MMSKEINVRTTREVEEWFVNNDISEDDKKNKGCPQVVSYIRWGNTTCPYGANTLYKGTAVGGRYTIYKGAPMCLSQNPMHYSSRWGKFCYPSRVSCYWNHWSCKLQEHALFSMWRATGQSDKIMITSHYVHVSRWLEQKNTMVLLWVDIILMKAVVCTTVLMKTWSK